LVHVSNNFIKLSGNEPSNESNQDNHDGGQDDCKRTGTGLIRFASHHRPCICSVVFGIVVADFVVIVVVSSRE
jgi:hypothetical protein